METPAVPGGKEATDGEEDVLVDTIATSTPSSSSGGAKKKRTKRKKKRNNKRKTQSLLKKIVTAATVTPFTSDDEMKRHLNYQKMVQGYGRQRQEDEEAEHAKDKEKSRMEQRYIRQRQEEQAAEDAKDEEKYKKMAQEYHRLRQEDEEPEYVKGATDSKDMEAADDTETDSAGVEEANDISADNLVNRGTISGSATPTVKAANDVHGVATALLERMKNIEQNESEEKTKQPSEIAAYEETGGDGAGTASDNNGDEVDDEDESNVTQEKDSDNDHNNVPSEDTTGSASDGNIKLTNVTAVMHESSTTNNDDELDEDVEVHIHVDEVDVTVHVNDTKGVYVHLDAVHDVNDEKEDAPAATTVREQGAASGAESQAHDSNTEEHGSDNGRGDDASRNDSATKLNKSGATETLNEAQEEETIDSSRDDSSKQVTDPVAEEAATLGDAAEPTHADDHDSSDTANDTDADDPMVPPSPSPLSVSNLSVNGGAFVEEEANDSKIEDSKRNPVEANSVSNNETAADQSIDVLNQDTQTSSTTTVPKKKSIEELLLPPDSDSDIRVSIVTWNLAEGSPPEEEAEFFRQFRNSDLVLISGQECENIKPRRSEGSRSREFRRLMIKMLGRKYVPLGIHSLGGIQFGIFCKRSYLHNVEHASIADVTCGIGNVFHNKGAIGAFLQVKASKPTSNAAREENGKAKKTAKSLRMLFITSHLAAHVKNSEARDADFWRIVQELEAQTPPRFLPPNPKAEDPDGSPSHVDSEGSGSYLLDSMDRVFFCGDLNYRINLPREEAEHAVELMKKNPDAADAHREQLLRHDQLLATMAERNAFTGLMEGKLAFLPTFKFDKETHEYDTSHKQRIPAWTDRVVFKPAGTRILEYASVPDALHSDHRPVYASFRVSTVGRDVPNAGRTERKRKRSRSSSRMRD